MSKPVSQPEPPPIDLHLLNSQPAAYRWLLRRLFGDLRVQHAPVVVWCEHGELRSQCPACGGDPLEG